MTPANRISMHQQLKVLCIADMNVYAKGRARARALTERSRRCLLRAVLRMCGSRSRLEMRGPETYAALTGYPDAHFDFALVDGTDRAGCVASVLPKLRPGGWIYLDNSDKDMTLADGNLRRAEAVLVEAARRCGGPVRYFVDFSPTNFFVEQGMLVQITAHS